MAVVHSDRIRKLQSQIVDLKTELSSVKTKHYINFHDIDNDRIFKVPYYMILTYKNTGTPTITVLNKYGEVKMDLSEEAHTELAHKLKPALDKLCQETVSSIKVKEETEEDIPF